MKNRFLISLLVLFVFCGDFAFAQQAGSNLAGSNSADARFMAGLREWGLYRLASEYCRGRLAENSLPDSHRTELVIELARSLAEWAVASPPDERGQRWDGALIVLRNDLKNRPDNRRAILVRLQESLSHLARGELAREEARLTAERKALLEEARAELRAAVRLLGRLREEVDEAVRLAGTNGSGRKGDGLSANELASLEKTVRYETARALRNQGRCFAADSPDRANSAARAIELLEPLTRLDTRDPLCWKSRIDRVACLILAGNYPEAVAGLDTLDKQEPAADVALRLRALRMEAALDQGQLSQAVGLLSLGRQTETTVSPQLDYAWLRTCLETWQAAVRADKQEAADEWQEKANKMVRLIEKSHGPYWARRAEMLAGSFYGGAGGNRALQTLIYAAESSYRSGQMDDALGSYDRAVAAAADNKQEAFKLAFTAAMIEQKRKRYEQAATRFRQLALDMPENAKAADAHMQAIWNAGRCVKQPKADTQAKAQNTKRRLDYYAMLLDEHARTWPDSTTADKARWMLGRLAQHRSDWHTAVAAYQAINPNDQRFWQAVRAAGKCCAELLSEQQANGKPTAAIAAHAADWFESHSTVQQGAAPPNASAEHSKPVGEEAAIAAARLRLNFTPDGFARAQQILEDALAAMPPASAADKPEPNRRAEMETLLVSALAGQARRQEAVQVLRRISGGGPRQLLDTLSRLDQLTAQATEKTRGELAGLVLQTADALRPKSNKLTPAQRRQMNLATARAMANVGRVDEALVLYRKLLATNPEDVETHQSLARLLGDRQDRTSLDAALREWRLIEKQLDKRMVKTENKSDRAAWFEAKLQIARLHVRLGNPKRAAKMIELMSILHPDLGGPKMKRQFEKILAECRKSP